jgi:uncharacterized protein YecE (DUF72 family)
MEVGQMAIVKVGTSSWTDPTLLRSGWYPPQASSPADRLGYYASRFSLVEVDSTYYSLPSERNSVLWAERTPPDFTFNIKAFSLMTGHSTTAAKLPPALRLTLPPHLTGADARTAGEDGPSRRSARSTLYMKDLPEEAQRWIWESFDRALTPLAEAGKLGAILLQFPPWFGINRENKQAIERCRAMLPHRRLAVEFRNHSWLEGQNAQETFALLADHDLTYVCVDEPQGFRSSVPPVTATTSPRLSMVRFHGRNRDTWESRSVTVTERFRYLYSNEELAEWVPRVQELSEQAEQTHVLFNNCYADFGVRNAADFVAQLQRAGLTR